MRVTFYRRPDHSRGHTLIERDDGVVYRLDGNLGGPELPHDLVHYTVEDALRMPDGIWGAIAGGVVFGSMTHESGRRPPHAAERSKEMIRAHRDLLQRAEHIGGVCERAAHSPDPARFLTAEPSPPVTLEQLRTATAALRAMEARWAALTVGDELVLEWPGHRSLRSSAATPAPTGQPGRSRSRRDRTTGRPTSSAASRRRTP